MSHPLTSELEAGLAALDLALEKSVQARLLAYLDLLARWNRSYNLTAVRKPRQMLVRHLFDSLVIRPYLAGERILDVGTGAGLPGIPLALACPGRSFTLLDSNGKKTRFVTQAVAELGLANVTVVQSRVEAYAVEAGFDTIVSRAYATLAEFAGGVAHLLAPGGQLLAMKGVYPVTELAQLAELATPFRLARNVELQVPGLEAERNLLILRRDEQPARAGQDAE